MMLTREENTALCRQNRAQMAGCRGCRHLVLVGGEWLCCNYLENEGRARPCRIENCTEKELKAPKRRSGWRIKTVALAIFTLALMALTLYLFPEAEAAEVEEIPEAVTEETAPMWELTLERHEARRRAGYKPERVEVRMEYLGRYYITGYDICVKCCGKTDGITASGVKAQVGRTCAAPKGFKFGERLYIEGLGERVVEDRGGAIKGNKIDVLCENHSQCYAVTGYYDLYRIVEGTP